ncbi:MAG: CDGSH iron-sulfur domain-containing protein, partial [Thermoanaerobaculia bacterium]
FKDPGELGEGRLVDAESEGDDLEISFAANGPILIRGNLRLVDAAEEQDMEGSKGALCRCGASQTKPYCDGSHTAVGFEAD